MNEENTSQPAPQPMASGTKGSNKVLLIIIGVVVLVAIAAGAWYKFGRKSGVVVTEDGKTVKYTTDDKSTTLSDDEGTLTMGEDVSLPKDFPKNTPVYSGIKLSSAFYEKDKSSAGYIGTVKKPKDEIINWYRNEYKKLGWQDSLSTPDGLTMKNDTQVSSVVVSLEEGGICNITVSTMNKSELPVTTSTGETDFDAVEAEAQQMMEDLESY